MAPSSQRFLFGGDQPWSPTNWTSSDDRVRGGSSYSTLTILPNNTVQFHGHLDITTLGGAGFAAQRTTDDLSWDLSDADGLELGIAGSDGKMYTLVLKDRLLPKRADGREQSTISWEYDFRTAGKAIVRVRWVDLRATYRGREADAEPLDLRNVKRISIMVRSFFGRQEGEFLLDIASIAAFHGDR
ncbi:CIA30 family protein [Aspergillus novofumigatus IBT 16806]|uniref:NADH:ubiquinone oxidoreductase complex I intermediate-associated protein 30 n=1 Tax=Aspergillus novofumigatus (strain IBT 16806) TaxID=1392255 RepID=A0A2I1CFK7_ASPN1|nr:NADH:ubiquinone oxidoreductase complex I intermediate-associated protein 30 [Aspergillus novofumigatus IBT 16806]PKX96416.1 NADH:ubiquinone oxidoreductase complex I intermediate-associated protein 30 [Aspergillus novofumigatus IBT 16806]